MVLFQALAGQTPYDALGPLAHIKQLIGAPPAGLGGRTAQRGWVHTHAATGDGNGAARRKPNHHLRSDRPPRCVLGDSKAIQRVRKAAEAAAQSPLNVLITGETGTGKELAARMVHPHSSRHHLPLLTRWNGRWVVGGRKSSDAGPRTVLYWLADDTLVPFAELPSDGETSYPGFVELSPSRAVVSWYSLHEKDVT